LTTSRKLNGHAPALLFAVGALALQFGCATAGLHPVFTADRVLGLTVGMTADSIVSLFGRPDRTQVLTCGSQTPSPWQCLIWEYDMGSNPRGRYQNISNTNRLTFSLEFSPPRLNSWTIDLMYDNQRP
jgi:hypothetical protein